MRIKNRILLLILPLLLTGASAGAVAAIEVAIAPGSSGTVGDVLDVELTTEDLTGLGVYSYEFEVTWSSSYFTVIDVIEAGTLTAGWGDVVFSAEAGRLTVAAAGAGALSGSGTLVTLRLQLGPSSGSPTIYFQDFVYNEGTPPVTTTNAYVTVLAAPTIWVTPDVGEILVGEGE